MKKVLLISVLILIQFFTAHAQEEIQNTDNNELNWTESFDEAKKIAVAENKSILIFFTGSDWCGICKMLDKDFLSSEKFKKIAAEKLVLYKADFPRRTDLVSDDQKAVNESLDLKYSKSRSKRSFPTIVITNSNGDELGYIETYNFIHDTTQHYNLIEEVVK